MVNYYLGIDSEVPITIEYYKHSIPYIEHCLFMESDKKDIFKLENLVCFIKRVFPDNNFFIYETVKGYHIISLNMFGFKRVIDTIANNFLDIADKKHFAFGIMYEKWTIRISKKNDTDKYKLLFWQTGTKSISVGHYIIFKKLIPELPDIEDKNLFYFSEINIRGYYHGYFK
jgi:hypothetical protein